MTTEQRGNEAGEAGMATMSERRGWSVAGILGRWPTAIVLIVALSASGLSLSPAAGQAITPEAIVRALLPAKAGPVTRSMSRAKLRGISIEGELPAELDLPSISLTVNFEFDSARLTNDARLTLRTLAAALKDPQLAGMTFQIAGHTDDVGSEQYNYALSQRRAEAVVSHLELFYGIPAARMRPVGYGKSRLAVPGDPKAAANRRVEIINTDPLTS